MASIYKLGKGWAVAYRLKGCPRKIIRGISTKALAEKVKAQHEVQEQFAKAGLYRPDPHEEALRLAAKKPLVEHLRSFCQDIIARGSGESYARQQASKVKRLLGRAKINTIDALALEPIQLAVFRLRGPKCGPRTANAYRQAVIEFEGYLKRTGKVLYTSLENLERFKEAEDVRRARRAFVQEEVDWLLDTTSRGGDLVGNICGIRHPDRAVLYAVGLGTGFRRGALLSLTKASFHVGKEVERPFVRLAASANKKRRLRDQLIDRDLADLLREWLADKPNTGPIWRPKPHADLSLRFRRDLEATRKAWIAAAPDDVDRDRRMASNFLRYVYHDGTHNVWGDFHSLRHTGITFVVLKAGLRVGQEWADHSTPLLTARYAHVDPEQMVEALKGLPTLTKGFTNTKPGTGGGEQR